MAIHKKVHLKRNEITKTNFKRHDKIMSVGSSVPSLRRFLIRQQVIGLYRDCLRTIRLLPDQSQRQELRDWARSDFKANKGVDDEEAIKALLQNGNRMLRELKQSMDLANA